MVMVRFRRSPIQTSDNTNCDRTLTSPLSMSRHLRVNLPNQDIARGGNRLTAKRQVHRLLPGQLAACLVSELERAGAHRIPQPALFAVVQLLLERGPSVAAVRHSRRDVSVSGTVQPGRDLGGALPGRAAGGGEQGVGPARIGADAADREQVLADQCGGRLVVAV